MIRPKQNCRVRSPAKYLWAYNFPRFSFSLYLENLEAMCGLDVLPCSGVFMAWS